MLTTKTAPSLNVLVGREVKAWMGRLDLNQADLSGILGYKQPQISQRLKGQIPFRIDELLKIASYMNITLEELLGQGLVNEKNPHLILGGGSRGRDSGDFVAGDGFEPSTSGL